MARQFDYGLDKKIIDVSFRSNALLFIRVNFYWTGEDLPPDTVCTVKDLPWGNFNFFAAENEDDTDFKDPTGKIDTRIVNPVSTGMLQRYNQFVLKDPVRDMKSLSIPGIDVAEITYAGWVVVFKGHITSRAVFGSRETALALAISTLVSEGEDSTDENTGVILQQYFNVHTGHLEDIPNYPDPIFISVFASAGWTYNVIPGKPGFVRKLINDAILHINVAKLRKVIPKGPDGKTPKDFTFKIFHPSRTGPHPSKSIMTTQAALYKTSVTKPPAAPKPKTDGRLDYLFIDKTIPAGTDYPEDTIEHLYPKWTPWPLTGSPPGETGSSGGGEVKIKDGNASGVVKVKITFAKGKESAKVELDASGTSTGEG